MPNRSASLPIHHSVSRPPPPVKVSADTVTPRRRSLAAGFRRGRGGSPASRPRAAKTGRKRKARRRGAPKLEEPLSATFTARLVKCLPPRRSFFSRGAARFFRSAASFRRVGIPGDRGRDRRIPRPPPRRRTLGTRPAGPTRAAGDPLTAGVKSRGPDAIGSPRAR